MGLSNYGKAQQIDLSKAIIQIIESFLPRFSKDQILSIPLTFSVEGTDKKNYEEIFKNEIQCEMIVYRPGNYTFIGLRQMP